MTTSTSSTTSTSTASGPAAPAAAPVRTPAEQIVAEVAHEVRAPLATVLSFLDLVLDNPAYPLAPEQARYLRIAEKHAQRALGVADDLLAVSARGIALRPGSVDLAELAAGAVEGARLAAAAHGVALAADVEAAAVVAGDAGRLARLLDHLVRNAIAATPAGGSVVVSSGRGSRGGWLAVADDGPGIPEEGQERLFEPYVRGPQGGSGGAGLGLAIVRAVAEAHGATLSLESAEGLGTIFVVEGLPLA